MSSLFSVNMPLVIMLPVLLGAILFDLILALGAAFKTNTFSVSVLPQFLKSQILTYYLPIAGLVALAQINFSYFGVNGAALGFSTASLVTLSWGAISFYGLKILFVNISSNFCVIFGITIPPLTWVFSLGQRDKYAIVSKKAEEPDPAPTPPTV